jgi:DNA transformation protein
MGSAPVRKKRGAPVKPARRPRERLASLKVSDAFKAFVLAQFDELGDVVPRSMFGGVGLYCRGVFFGIIAQDTLYLKVDDQNRNDYDSAGMKPFRPYAHRSGTMEYYAVPVNVLESASELAAWARKSIAVAERK